MSDDTKYQSECLYLRVSNNAGSFLFTVSFNCFFCDLEVFLMTLSMIFNIYIFYATVVSKFGRFLFFCFLRPQYLTCYDLTALARNSLLFSGPLYLEASNERYWKGCKRGLNLVHPLEQHRSMCTNH